MPTLSSVQRTLVVTSIVVLAANVVVMGNPPAASKSSVTVKTVLLKKTFLLGQRVLLDTVAVNHGDTEVRVSLGMHGLSIHATHLIVQDDMGQQVKYIGPSTETFGEKWRTVPPGELIGPQVNLGRFFDISQPGKYRVRCYAYIANTKVYSNWCVFQVVPGKEAFRKDIKLIRPHPQPDAPKHEDASLIVYALPKVHLAYYKRTFQKDGKKTTIYKRMIEVDPAWDPQVLIDVDGEVHILLARRQLPKNQIEKRFKDFPSTYKMHLKYRRYMWYKTVASHGRLQEYRRLSMAKEDKTELRLVEAANRTVEVHEFKDVGVYSPPWKKPRRRSRSSQQPGVTKTSDAPKESP